MNFQTGCHSTWLILTRHLPNSLHTSCHTNRLSPKSQLNNPRWAHKRIPLTWTLFIQKVKASETQSIGETAYIDWSLSTQTDYKLVCLSSKEWCFPTKGGKHKRGETYFSSNHQSKYTVVSHSLATWNVSTNLRKSDLRLLLKGGRCSEAVS